MAKRNFKVITLDMQWFMGETTITANGFTFTHLDLVEAASQQSVMDLLRAKASEWIEYEGITASVTKIVEVSNETANELRLKKIL